MRKGERSAHSSSRIRRSECRLPSLAAHTTVLVAPLRVRRGGMRKSFFALLAAAGVLLCASAAQADDTIKHPGDHPHYAVEIEPHALFGLTASTPSADTASAGGSPSPSSRTASSRRSTTASPSRFGLDYLPSDGVLREPARLRRELPRFPVALQWNFFVAQRWSVFGEPGLTSGTASSPAARRTTFARLPDGDGRRPRVSSGSAAGTTSTTESRSRCASAFPPSRSGCLSSSSGGDASAPQRHSRAARGAGPLLSKLEDVGR